MNTESPLHLQTYRGIEQREPYEGYPYFPSLAYQEFLSTYPVASERPFYASMAITSGGYRRDESLEIGDVIAKNTEYGSHLREYFTSNNLGPSDVIVPSELGSMRQAYWGQLDFLMLWYHIMAGVDEQDAWRIEKQLRGDGVYKDAKWAQQDLLGETTEDKWRAYVRFTEGYTRVLRDKKVVKYAHRPVKGVLGVLDGEMSLGGKAEKLLTQHLGIPFYSLEVQEQSVSAEFYQELQKLTALGARALSVFPEQGPRLIFKAEL